MKNIFTVILLLASTSSIFAQIDSISFRLLPDDPYIPVFTANPTAHRLSLVKSVEQNRYFGSMGAVRPLFNAMYRQWTVQFSLAATYDVTLQKPTAINWQVIDGSFFIDLFIDVPLDSLTAIRFGPGHTSQHLMDDAIELLGFPHSVNYVRDYYQLFAVRRIEEIRGYVYGGGVYNYNFRLDSVKVPSWMFEAGCETLPVRLAESVFLYGGFDIKFRGELSYGTSQNYELGVKFAKENGRALRAAYHFRTGLEERGQFFREKNDWHTVGVYIDF